MKQFYRLSNKNKLKVTSQLLLLATFFTFRREKGKDLTLEFLRQIATFCQVATVNQATISMALATNFKDFEDAILYAAAVINNLDAIVTRNQKDFPVTTPRILTPEQLIQELTSA